VRQKENIDREWKFHFGEVPEPKQIWGFQKSGAHNQGGANKDLNDSTWRTVNLPHDYVMEGPATPSFAQWTPDNVIPNLESVGNLHTTRGSRFGGIAWYRKHLHKIDTTGKRVFLRFDGIYRDSQIYLNNFFVGRHMSGYTGVTYDITDFLYSENENVLAVRVDASQAEGWFYEGGGIYRHVWLITTPLAAIDNHGVFVKSEVDLENHRARVTVQTTLRNYNSTPETVAVAQTVRTPEGRRIEMEPVTVALGIHEKKTVEQWMDMEHPALWEIDSPTLYTLNTVLSSGDSMETQFGIRHIHFDKDTGFYLNGKNIKLKGVCCHQDHAGLGVALPDGMQEYRIRKLKEMGCNAYRSAHNPATEELIQVCDRLGMLVMDENRLLSSSSEDLEQLDELILSARNHPSIFIWSLGNEEGTIHFTENGRKIAETMRNHVRELDGTRPVTVAVCFWDASSNYKGIDDPAKTGTMVPSLDVFGFNYFTELWDGFRQAYPEIPLICTEHTSMPCTRGCRVTDNEKCHQSITDPETMSYGAGEEAWKAVKNREYMAGIFVWTGFDYHGEPSPFGWPAVSSSFGILDLCGFKKDAFYYYKACWDEEALLHLCADDKVVWTITNCDEVELFADGVSQGRRTAEKDTVLKWEDLSIFTELTAVGYRNGQEAARDILPNYARAEKLAAVVDGCFQEKDGSKTVVVNFYVQDEQGNTVEIADDLITLQHSPHAVLLGTGNGDPSDHDSCKLDYRRAFNGKMQAIFSVSDKAEIIATAPGLEKAVILLDC